MPDDGDNVVELYPPDFLAAEIELRSMGGVLGIDVWFPGEVPGEVVVFPCRDADADE